MNMRYLTDTEIINWNDKIKSSNYMIRPSSHNRSGNVDIVFVQKTNTLNTINSQSTFVETTDPSIRFNYLFSISSTRTKEFWEIFNRRKSVPIGTCTRYKEKIEEISFDEVAMTESKEVTNHKIKELEYTRYSYELKGKLSQIIAFTTTIEDTIKFFTKIYGYTENGKEVILTNFPIGQVCSKKSDKSTDYIVLDYDYIVIFNEFKINYKIAKMEWSPNSPIVTYGEPETVTEDELCFSRNNRIDNILEQ